MKKCIWRAAKLWQLRMIAWLSKRSPCLAMRYGLVSIYAAEITEGPDKGLPLGIALAMDSVRMA